MAKPGAAGPFDVTEHACTHTFLEILTQALLHAATHLFNILPPTHTHAHTHMCTLPYSYVPGSGSLEPPLVLWWLVLMSLPNDLARVER